MRQLILGVLSFFIICASANGDNFGYVSYSTFNIGDDFQGIAAKRFLPDDCIAIDREFIGAYENGSTTHTILNGWYMHTKDFYWYRTDVPAPKKSWPPAPCINPLLISIHINEGVFPVIFSEEGVDYLKKHAPIGARDLTTLRELQKRDIPSYFSGCLTLTLENNSTVRDNVIYAVDINESLFQYICSKAKCKVEKITHYIGPPFSLDQEGRSRYVHAILEKYKRAKCVVTTRFHAAVPCLGLQTPVLLINSNWSPCRFDGIRDLLRNCSEAELLAGAVDFDFNQPSPNPETYLPLRNNLIAIVNDWIEKNKLHK